MSEEIVGIPEKHSKLWELIYSEAFDALLKWGAPPHAGYAIKIAETIADKVEKQWRSIMNEDNFSQEAIQAFLGKPGEWRCDFMGKQRDNQPASPELLLKYLLTPEEMTEVSRGIPHALTIKDLEDEWYTIRFYLNAQLAKVQPLVDRLEAEKKQRDMCIEDLKRQLAELEIEVARGEVK